MANLPGTIAGGLAGAWYSGAKKGGKPGTIHVKLIVDVVSPVVANFTPSVGSTIACTDALTFDVTDVNSLTRIVVQVQRVSGIVEVIHDGTSFRGSFSGSRTLIANGFAYSVTRTGFGWPSSAITLRIFAIDIYGNQSTPTDFDFTVSNPLDPTEMVDAFVMVGRDDGAAPPGYVTWQANSYDSAGAGFSGGTPTPVGSFITGSAFMLARFKRVM